MSDLTHRINNELRKILTETEAAARRQDVDAAARWAKKAADLKARAADLSLLTQQIEQMLTPEKTEPGKDGTHTELRRLPVQVTGGMIRQRLLLLTEHVQHRQINVGEKLEITADASREKFTTVLLKDYKLRERGAIGQFYRAANVREGDVVVLIETAPGKWALTKGEAGEWDGHYRYKRVRYAPPTSV